MTPALVDRCKVHQSLWQALDHLGLPPAAVLREARLPQGLRSNPQRLFTTAELFAVWKAIETLADDPGFGIRLVESMDETGHQPAFIAACYAASYRDGLYRLDRFKRFGSCEHFHFEHAKGRCAIYKDWPCATEPVPAIAIDVTFVFLIELGRKGTGQRLTPAIVEFARCEQKADVYRDYFGCRIQYGASSNRLVLKSADLERPFSGHNPELLEMLTPALAATVQEVEASANTGEQIKAVLKRTLASGRPTIADVARDLGVSDRTLQRRITEENTTYRSLLRQARQELGRQLLSDLTLSTDDVACLLGYQDLSSFYRAFKGWEGTTPNQWRALQCMG